MTRVRFDLKCEGDIEKFSKWARERVTAKKKTEVVLGVPNLHWPRMVVDMLLKDAEEEEDADNVYMDVDFDVKHVDLDLAVSEDELQDMIEDMSDEEIQEWIDDMLDQYEEDKDADNESDNEDESQ